MPEELSDVQLSYTVGNTKYTKTFIGTRSMTIDRHGLAGVSVSIEAARVETECKVLPLPVEFGTVIEGDYPGRRDRFILLPSSARAGWSGWRSFKTGEMVGESHIANWKIVLEGSESD